MSDRCKSEIKPVLELSVSKIGDGVNIASVVGKSPSRTVPDRTYDCTRSWYPENNGFRYRLLSLTERDELKQIKTLNYFTHSLCIEEPLK